MPILSLVRLVYENQLPLYGRKENTIAKTETNSTLRCMGGRGVLFLWYKNTPIRGSKEFARIITTKRTEVSAEKWPYVRTMMMRLIITMKYQQAADKVQAPRRKAQEYLLGVRARA